MTHDSPPNPGTGSGPGATRPAVTTSYRYAPIPEALLYDHEIDPLAVRVYGCLARHGDTAANCYPSHGRIGDLIGVAKRSIARPLKALEDAGWIVRYPRYDERGQRIADGYDLRAERAAERAHHAEERGTPTLVNGDYPTLSNVDIEGEPVEREPVNDPPLSSGSTTERDSEEEAATPADPTVDLMAALEESLRDAKIATAAALHARRALAAQPPGSVRHQRLWRDQAEKEWREEHLARCKSLLDGDRLLSADALLAKIDGGTSLPGYKLNGPPDLPTITDEDRKASAATRARAHALRPENRTEATG